MSTKKKDMPAGAALSPFDIADHLRSPEEVADYLQAVIEDHDGDSRVIVAALGDAAKALGMQKVARKTGLNREGLYKALSGEANPSFDTVLKVMRAVGVELKPVPRPKSPEVVTIKGQKYRRITFGPAYGWSEAETEAFIAEGPEKLLPAKKGRKRLVRNAATGEGIISRAKRTAPRKHA